ncbi:superinfection immunity protein [Gracilibacillus pellucidus]|uniref:superinfection immunity protein n=1 Tax=Gracilibacillus pellucidus TaxID=3095368 RepID=UPI0039B6F1DD
MCTTKYRNYFYLFLTKYCSDSEKKSNKITIYAINFFLGWIFIGWVAALYLAMKKPVGKITKI